MPACSVTHAQPSAFLDAFATAERTKLKQSNLQANDARAGHIEGVFVSSHAKVFGFDDAELARALNRYRGSWRAIEL